MIPPRFVATGADAVRLSPGGAAVGTPSRARPKAKSVPSKPRSGVRTAMRRKVPTLRREPLALNAMRQRDSSLQIGGRPAPAADRRQRHASRRARVPLTMIESLTAIELSLVQPIEESGSELRRNDPVLSESSQPLEQHAQS